MKIEILYEDKDILVLNKPTGLVIHSDGRTKEKNLCDWILENYPAIKEVGEPLELSSGEKIYRPGIVHRLDRDTSGVIVVAKNQKSFLFLKEQFKGREIKKKYNAFVYGEMKEDEGVINRPIGKSRKDFRMWSAQRGARGEMREAITEFKTLKKSQGYSYIELMPKTGRTHQLRVHMKAINFPIICDKLYAPKRPKALGFERLALHARNISFKGMNNKEITVEAPLPKDFKNAIKEMDEVLHE